MDAMEFLNYWLENNGRPRYVDRSIINREYKKFQNFNPPENIQKELLNQIKEYKIFIEKLPENSSLSKIQISKNSLHFSTQFFNDIWSVLRIGGNIRVINSLPIDNSKENSIEKNKLILFLNQLSTQIQELKNVTLLHLLKVVTIKKKEFYYTFN